MTRIVLSQLSAIQERGARLMTGLRAEAIETTGGRVAGVATASGMIEAPTVISATGAWAKDLAAPLGLDLPIEPRLLDTMYLRQPPGGAQIGCCITDGNSNVAIRPDMGRDILVGAYPKEMPLVDDPAAGPTEAGDAAHLDRIRAALGERLPGLAQAAPHRSVSGTYDITPDWHPVIGWAPGIEGLYVAAGFSGHGLKLSPSVGEAVAAAVLGAPSPFDLNPLRLERFDDGEPMFLAYGPGGRA